MLKKISIASLALLGCLFMCGCPKKVRLESAVPLNKGLSYLPWPTDSPPRSDYTIRIQPGMRLVFRYSPLRGLGATDQIPGRSESYYVVPGEPFDRRDYEFLEWVLATGQLNPKDKEIAKRAHDYVKNPGGQDFYLRYVDEVLKPTLWSMELQAPPKEAIEFTGAGSEIRKWLAEPARGEYEAPDRTMSKLVVNLHLGKQSAPVPITIFQLSPAYFNDEVGSASGVSNNPFYGATVSNARGYVDVEIPVRLNGERSSRYFPAYYTARDIQDCLGLAVLGLRRSERYFKPEVLSEAARAQLERLKGHYVAKDGYFTVWFDDQQKTFGAKGFFHVDDSHKSEVLLAPGDVVYLYERVRIKPTDSPERRCGTP